MPYIDNMSCGNNCLEIFTAQNKSKIVVDLLLELTEYNQVDTNTHRSYNMSKVEFARKIFDQNPSFSRKELIEALMSQLNMTKAGATTYAYNLSKGQPKAAKPAKAAKAAKVTRSKTVTEISRSELPKQSKAERMAMMAEVGRKQKELEEESMKQDREVMQAEIDEYVNEASAYVASLNASTRKFILLAE